MVVVAVVVVVGIGVAVVVVVEVAVGAVKISTLPGAWQERHQKRRSRA